MLLRLLSSGADFRYVLIVTLLQIPIILFSLSLHESAHGFIAYKMGDPTAKNLGRITLNPIKHFDLFGALCMFFVGIGWAKPVPIFARNFKKPKRGMALSALAGPMSNLIFAFICSFIARIIMKIMLVTVETASDSGFSLIYIIFTLFSMAAEMNVYLAVFNLLPIPPFDGSRILFAFLPDRLYFGLMKYEQYIKIAILILLWTGLLDIPFAFLTNKILLLYSTIIGLVPFL